MTKSKRMICRFLIIFTLSLSSIGVLLADTHENDSLLIRDAWIREAPPTSSVQAAYLTAINNSQKAISITSISSPAFNAIESHRTTAVDGMVSMERIKVLTIAPESEVHLEPGGMHLMLFKPTRRLLDGDKVELLFKLDDGSCISATATVRRATGN